QVGVGVRIRRGEVRGRYELGTIDEDWVGDGPGGEVGGVEACAHVVEADARVARCARVEAALGGGLVPGGAIGICGEARAHLSGAGGLCEEGAELIVEEEGVRVGESADGALLDGRRS